VGEVLRESSYFAVLDQDIRSEAEVGVDYFGIFEKESAKVREQ